MAERLVVKVTHGSEALERLNQAVTVAATALSADVDVSLWLTGEAVWLAVPGRAEEWELVHAGQRVQVMRKDKKKGGVLQFGTELITADDGSIAGLLGASPGASTAVPIMIDLLGRCFPNHSASWKSRLTDLIPSLGQQLDENPALADEIMGHTGKTLGIR